MKRLRATRFSSPATASRLCSFAVIGLSPAAGSASALGAQTSDAHLSDAHLSVAHVPFDFSVGEITLRAGPYTVAPSERAGVVTMRPSDEASPQLLVQAIHVPATNEASAGHILFYCRCERYYLAQVLAQAA
jgi:hypothetical protein